MLVLTRRLNEKIVISDNIVIQIVEIRANKVRLGVTAPGHIPVHRQEIYDLSLHPDPVKLESQR